VNELLADEKSGEKHLQPVGILVVYRCAKKYKECHLIFQQLRCKYIQEAKRKDLFIEFKFDNYKETDQFDLN